MEFFRRALAAFFDFLQSIVVVLAILVMVYLFIMSPQEISGQSMDPTFHNGEYILTNKIEYKLHNPARGDVVIFHSPKNRDIDYIKRVIGLPGDRVKLYANTMYINGERLNEPYIDASVITSGGSCLRENQELIVPKGKYFVMGDNRPHSSDSREFCAVIKEDFIGKALLRYWPFSNFGLIANPDYN